MIDNRSCIDKMSSSNSLAITPPEEQQGSIDTIPPTPQEQTALEEIFDSYNNPDVKQYLAAPMRRPRKPRKSPSKPANQNLSSSGSTTDTDASYITAFESPATSGDGSAHDDVTVSRTLASLQNRTEDDVIALIESPVLSLDGGEVDQEFPERRMRPHSGVISISPEMTNDELRQELAAKSDKNRQLTKVNLSLERTIEGDTIRIEELQDALKRAKTAKNNSERCTVKAGKDLAVLQDTYHEVVSRNAEVEELNKRLRRETAQSKSSEDKCHLQNSSLRSQIDLLNEDAERKNIFIGQLKEKADLLNDRNVALAEFQRLASDGEVSREFLHANSALKRELDIVRSQLQEVKEQQDRLEDDLWKHDDGQTATPGGFYTSTPENWNCSIAESQTLQGQRPTDTLTLIDASTSSPPSLASPQSVVLSPGGGDLLTTNSDKDLRNIHMEGTQGNIYWWSPDSDENQYRIVCTPPKNSYKKMNDAGDATQVPAVLGCTKDSGTQTGDISMARLSPLFVVTKHHRSLTFNHPVSSISSEPLPVKGKQVETPISSDNISSFGGKQAPENGRPLSMSTIGFPVRPKEYQEQTHTGDAGAAYIRVAIKTAYPTWYYVVLGLLIMLFFTHAFFQEKRFWRDANEQTRHAVVTMRDERWGQEWVEKMGYALEQKLGVDRTGFC